MKRWPIVTLEEVSDGIVDGPFGSNLKLSDYVETGVPVLQGKNITGNEFQWFDVRYISRTKAEELKRSEVRVGDHLLIKIGSIGYSAIIDSLQGFDFAIIPANLARIRPETSKINSAFLHYVLTSPQICEAFKSRTSQTAQPALSLRTIKAMQIPLPPLPEQERVVKLLDEADELRKLRAQSDRRAATLIPALFREMFGDPGTNPKGWPSGSLKDFGAEIRYGLGQPPEEDPEGVPILRATNVKRGYISEVGLIRVRRDAVPVSRNAFLNADDVLVVRSGAYTGDIARVGEKWAGSVAGYDLVVSPKERFAGDFIAWFLLSDFVQDRYFNGLKLRAAQPHLNSTQVSETPFLCPPFALQKEFAARVTEIRAMQTEQSAGRKRLDDLFQSMLHRAFEGEL